VEPPRRQSPGPQAPVGPPARVRVLVVDHQVLFAEALEVVLRMDGYYVRHCSPSGPGTSVHTLMADVTRLHPDIALLALDLGPAVDGVSLIGPLVRHGVSVVVVTESTDPFRWGEALHHGATTVIPKVRPLEEILATVRRISVGLPVLDPGQRDRLVRRWTDSERERRVLRERFDRLTEREREVLAHLSMGRTVSDIAAIRTVSEGTVRTQVKSVLAKLEVSSQIAAVGLARRAGWRPHTFLGPPRPHS
jgi:two-component system, NarL family, nitrate/nitrite response regulator NarL